MSGGISARRSKAVGASTIARISRGMMLPSPQMVPARPGGHRLRKMDLAAGEDAEMREPAEQRFGEAEIAATVLDAGDDAGKRLVERRTTGGVSGTPQMSGK